MNIKHDDQNTNGTFYFEEAGERLAELEYHLSASDEMTIYHTEVDEAQRGNDVGSKLVDAAINYARASNLKVIPTCSFAKKLINHTAEYQDVLA